jgi:hypothetical protein
LKRIAVLYNGGAASDRQVEAYTDRGSTGYLTRTDFLPGQQLPDMIAAAHVGQIAVADVLA